MCSVGFGRVRKFFFLTYLRAATVKVNFFVFW